MKNFHLFLCLFFSAATLWADDGLTPESLRQAVQEYQGFWKVDRPDPSNHEIWKLYVYKVSVPKDAYNKSPKWLRLGLTPAPKDHYYVTVRINDIYNFLGTMPQRGDVVVVAGSVKNHIGKHLSMSIENAKLLPNEHVNIALSSPDEPANDDSSESTPTAATQGVSAK